METCQQYWAQHPGGPKTGRAKCFAPRRETFQHEGCGRMDKIDQNATYMKSAGRKVPEANLRQIDSPAAALGGSGRSASEVIENCSAKEFIDAECKERPLGALSNR